MSFLIAVLHPLKVGLTQEDIVFWLLFTLVAWLSGMLQGGEVCVHVCSTIITPAHTRKVSSMV